MGAACVAISNMVGEPWGREVSWAHSVLSIADLKTFSERTVMKTESRKRKSWLKGNAMTSWLKRSSRKRSSNARQKT
ncbi:hypothetical protein BKA63DRAFT_510887 [Paraphoma chrysanthemicola]|nr:hypothetical protein BKA63DRAFT_510887 [Paraphoma chrysanthemicola]